MGRRRCETCGSKQWHKDPSSGLVACSEGHILQGYRNETREVQEFGPHTMNKRSMKSRSENKGRQSAANPMLYHGARGRYHYLLCLQFILRRQIAELMKLWSLPSEFEVLCKDIWTLHLTMLPKPVPDETFDGDQQQKDDDSSGGQVDEQDYPKPPVEESELDPELEALMQEIDSSPTSSENEGDSNSEAEGLTNARKGKGRSTRKSRNRSSYETPMNTVAVLVVACWIMRIPIIYRDFIKLIERYDLPYLDPIRWLPGSMAEHLTRQNIQGLSPNRAPVMLELHATTGRLCKRLYSDYGVFVPEANAPSILWRLVKDMGCTPVMYLMTKKFAIDRCMSLALHSSLAPGVRRPKGNEAGGHVSDSVPVEVKLMGALVMVIKMAYGLDEQAPAQGGARVSAERGPTNEKDATYALPRKAEFLDGIREMIVDDKIWHAGEMGNEKMDEYIAFCEEALLGRDNSQLELDGLFPLGEKKGKGYRKGGLLSGEEQHRLCAGEEYNSWNELESDEYEIVIERATKLLGVDAEYLSAVVQRLDIRR